MIVTLTVFHRYFYVWRRVNHNSYGQGRIGDIDDAQDDKTPGIG